MFRVDADSLAAYRAFDPARKPELAKLHAAVRAAAPSLTCHFHPGTPAGTPGMRFKMIGYGRFRYPARGGTLVSWPVIGVALQKNYISVYVPLTKRGKPLVATHAAKLDAHRTAPFNFSFVCYDDLDAKTASALFADAARIFESDPENPVRCMQGA